MRGSARIMEMLRTTSRDAFHEYFTTLLGAVMRPVAATARMGELDRMGVDSFSYETKTGRISLAVQCKGFEKPTFEDDQLEQCIGSIKKFNRMPASVDAYWIVINRAITRRHQREEIELHLQALVANGKANSYKLIDLSRILPELQEHAVRLLKEWAAHGRESLMHDYAERLQIVPYIAEVPVTCEKPRSNPSRFAFETFTSYLAAVPPGSAGAKRKAPRMLLYSGFGFGKTSTLHEVARLCAEAGLNPLYIPAAFLPREAFVRTADVVTVALDLLQPDNVDLSDSARDLLRDTLRRDLANAKDWLLLIDGIDENEFALGAGALTTLWNGIRDLGLPAIVSVREELFDLRREDFLRDPLGRVRGGAFFQTMQLTDWTPDLLTRFLDDYPSRDRAHAQFAVFERVIRAGHFDQVYGDIPKRPLFLGMLAADAFAGLSPERELHRLYGTYFRQKFGYDRASQAAHGVTSRRSTIVDRFGVEEAEVRLMQLMERVAHTIHLRRIAADNSRSVPASGAIAERELKVLARDLDIIDATLEEVVLHSLLRPGGRDGQTRDRLVLFSHRSFEEWFLARRLASLPAEDVAVMVATLSDGTVKFLQAMQRDVAMGLDLP